MPEKALPLKENVIGAGGQEAVHVPSPKLIKIKLEVAVTPPSVYGLATGAGVANEL